MHAGGNLIVNLNFQFKLEPLQLNTLQKAHTPHAF